MCVSENKMEKYSQHIKCEECSYYDPHWGSPCLYKYSGYCLYDAQQKNKYFIPTITYFWYFETDIECELFCSDSADGFERPAKCRYCHYNANGHSNFVRCTRNIYLENHCPDWNVVQELLEINKLLRNIVCPSCFSDNIFLERKNGIYGCWNCERLFQVKFRDGRPVRYHRLYKMPFHRFVRQWKWTPLEVLKEICSEIKFMEDSN